MLNPLWYHFQNLFINLKSSKAFLSAALWFSTKKSISHYRKGILADVRHQLCHRVQQGLMLFKKNVVKSYYALLFNNVYFQKVKGNTCRHINLITIASLLTPLTPTVEKWTSSVGGRRRKIDAIRRSIDRTLQTKQNGKQCSTKCEKCQKFNRNKIGCVSN